MHTLPWKMGLCWGEQQIHLGGRGRIVGWARESGSRGEEWWWDTDPTPAGEHGEGRTVGKAERARVPPLSYRPHQDSHPTSLGALALHTTHASLWAPREDPAHCGVEASICLTTCVSISLPESQFKTGFV